MVNEGAGQMYYTDFSSFADVAVTTVGGGAEMGTPGVMTQFISKSGGNTYHGNVYFDYQNESLEAHNIDDAQQKTRNASAVSKAEGTITGLRPNRSASTPAG